jgi:alpha-glucosidase
MAIPIPTYTDFDASIWQQELEDFVPESVVDAHTHIWNERFAGSHIDENFVLRMEVSLDDLHTWSRRLLPGRKLGYVVLPSPMVGIDYSGHNDWTARQVVEYPNCHQGFPVASGPPVLLEAAMLVYPGLTPVEVAAHHERWGVRILKPYRVFAADPAEARIADYLLLARRSGRVWYAGAMTDGTGRELVLDLSFLPVGSYTMTLFSDGPNAGRAAMDYTSATRLVTVGERIPLKLAPGGGAAARFEPAVE